MRARSSSAKSRLRSAGYKCNLCGRRVIDAATLERHQKTIHNVYTKSSRTNFKAKSAVQKNKLGNKDKEKGFLVRQPIRAESKVTPRNSRNNYSLRDLGMGVSAKTRKVSSKNTNELAKNCESLLKEDKKTTKKENTDVSKKVQFECPVCTKTFNAYFTAHKHIQKVHALKAGGNKHVQNSLDLFEPIRLEQCYKCNTMVRSNERHICPKNDDETISVTTEYMCSGCHQRYVSLKTFDLHVAGLHSDGVDSMFFPTKLEFANWRLEMERETNAKFSLFGEYESKKVYRCNYAKDNAMNDKSTAYICPSSIVVQDFSKGIQVHYYNTHYEHPSKAYTLSNKYKTYSITSFLKNPNDGSAVKTASMGAKLDVKDLYSQYKKLMENIVLSSADIDEVLLKTLIERALDMSAILTESSAIVTIPAKTKPEKNISDKEITEALEFKSTVHKRRRSVDGYETLPKPAKRTRNKSLFMQSENEMSPKILNTFSLASNSDKSDFESVISNNITNDETESLHNISSKETNARVNNFAKMVTRHSSSNELSTFNDSYKDFIDKNFIAKKGDNIMNLASPRCKAKFCEFKPTSPREDLHNDLPVKIKFEGGVISATPINVEDTNPNPKINKANTDSPKKTNSNVNIISDETSRITYAKGSSLKTGTLKMPNPVNSSRLDKTNLTSKVSTRAVLSQLIEPLQTNVEKMKMGVPSPLADPLQTKYTKVNKGLTDEYHKRNIGKVNTRSGSSPTVDSLQINNVAWSTTTPFIEIDKGNISKFSSRRVASPVDPLQLNNTKGKIKGVETNKAKSSKVTPNIDSLKLNTNQVELSKTKTPKLSNSKVHPDKLTANETPVVTKTVSAKLEGTANRAHSSAEITHQKKINDFKYEVREQENDCNILVLKFT